MTSATGGMGTTQPNMGDFRANLRQLMRLRGLTQHGLAELAPFKQQSVSQWLKSSEPSLGAVYELRQSLDVSWDELLGKPSDDGGNGGS